MDPRQALSRTASSSLQQQSPYNNPNMASAYNGTMPQSSYGPTHLPPINAQYPPPSHLPPTNNQGYMPQQQYRADPMRSYSQNPSPAATPDNRYPSHMAPQQSMGNMPQSSMLPQPGQSQTPQPQPYTTQAGSRPSSYPQPLAPAPPRSSMNDPYGNYGQPDRPWTGAEQMPGMTTDVGRDPTRTHVVGSQGRRGILPSAPGRPPVMQNGLNGSPKGNTIPQKDADGKFPCPNCTKTYLHAKHLKRHMLRHTGDRPYMCVLCTDTFSRSDILKRHFQKCSVRRGNPTGASHLSNPAAHLKKSQAAAQKAAAAAAQASAAQSPAGPQSSNQPPASSAAVHPSPYATSMPGSSMPTTTASLPAMSSMPYVNGQNDSKPPMGQQMQGGQDQNNGPGWGMHNGRNSQLMYSSNTASPAQGGHHVENDWNQFLPPAGNENYMGQMYGYEQAHPEVKNESHESGSNGYYMPSTSLGADGTLGPPLWHFNSALDNPLQLKVKRLVDFCFPQESLHEHQNNDALRSCLTVDNVKHFLELYQNYQGHFPWLHIPTLDLFNIYDGLLLILACSGAVYSDRVSQAEVRSLVLYTKAGIQRTSHLLRYYSTEEVISPADSDLEELQAMFLVQSILTWHGGPGQRAEARAGSRRLSQLIRQCQLLKLATPGQPAYSYLHNVQPGQAIDATQWNWHAWLQQEKRLRIVFLAILSDAALTLYFNCSPEFQTSEVRLPLPCDDAAWEAPDETRCASALGLHGPYYQSQFNTVGSLKPRQLNFDFAYRALQDSSISVLQPRDTNIYGKFILIHALHMDIWRLQKQRSFLSPNASPYADTVTVNVQTQQHAISLALTRWKQCWDADMQLQYPSMPGMTIAPKRIGFCRDGIHFYWLAKAFLQPNRIRDWQLPADIRFRQFMHGLKKARDWSLSDGAQRGEEPGSVADIDPTYETEDLELDMRKLFRPLMEVSRGRG